MDFYLFCLIFMSVQLPQSIEAIKCHYFDDSQYSDENSTKSCEGDVCLMVKSQDYKPLYFQKCVSGVDMPSNPACELGSDDSLTCYCNTDFCNNRTLLIQSEIEPLPIVECRSVLMKEFIPVSCNYCMRTQSYELIFYPIDDPFPLDKEEVGCTTSDEKGRIMYQTGRGLSGLFHNFFPNACYNITLAQKYQWEMYCRCNTTNCNDPLEPFPFPIKASPTVTCQTYGEGFRYNCTGDACGDKTRFLTDKKNLDENKDGECQGHICFIAQIEVVDLSLTKSIDLYKGCISANEQGPEKLKMGYNRFRDIDYYLCNMDDCNSNIETALEAARNSSALKILQRDNKSDRNSAGLTITILMFMCWTFS